MLSSAFLEGRRRSTHSINTRPRSSNTAGAPGPVLPESSRSGRRTNCLRWNPRRAVCRPYPARVRRLWGFGVKALPRVCEPSVVLDLYVITREQRQVLSSNRCVVSGRARRVETGRGSGAASSCGGECAHGCNGVTALVSRLPQRRRAVVAGRCRVAVVRTQSQRCAPAKIGYERCKRGQGTLPDRLSPRTEAAAVPAVIS